MGNTLEVIGLLIIPMQSKMGLSKYKKELAIHPTISSLFSTFLLLQLILPTGLMYLTFLSYLKIILDLCQSMPKVLSIRSSMSTL